MPYISTVNEQAYRVNTDENSSQRDITIDDTTYKIDWRLIAPLAADARGLVGTGGRYSLIIAGKSYEIFARRVMEPGEEANQTYEGQFWEQRFEGQVEDEREKALAGSVKSMHEGGEKTGEAPMPRLGS